MGKMKRISYSQYSSWASCPYKWKLNYIDKLRQFTDSIHTMFGTSMHEVLQKYLEIMYNDSIKNADLLNLEEMLRDKLIEQFKKAEEEKRPIPPYFNLGCVPFKRTIM